MNLIFFRFGVKEDADDNICLAVILQCCSELGAGAVKMVLLESLVIACAAPEDLSLVQLKVVYAVNALPTFIKCNGKGPSSS